MAPGVSLSCSDRIHRYFNGSFVTVASGKNVSSICSPKKFGYLIVDWCRLTFFDLVSCTVKLIVAGSLPWDTIYIYPKSGIYAESFAESDKKSKGSGDKSFGGSDIESGEKCTAERRHKGEMEVVVLSFSGDKVTINFLYGQLDICSSLYLVN